jgi:hypothetical protein
LLDRPFRLSCRVGDQVIIAQAIDLESAAQQFT